MMAGSHATVATLGLSLLLAASLTHTSVGIQIPGVIRLWKAANAVQVHAGLKEVTPAAHQRQAIVVPHAGGVAADSLPARRLLQNGFVFGRQPSPSPSPRRPRRPADTAVLPNPVFGDDEGGGALLPVPENMIPDAPPPSPPDLPAPPPPASPQSVFDIYPSGSSPPPVMTQGRGVTMPDGAPLATPLPPSTMSAAGDGAPSSGTPNSTIIAAVVSSVVAVAVLALLVAFLVHRRLKQATTAAQYPPPAAFRGWNSYTACQSPDDGPAALNLMLGKNLVPQCTGASSTLSVPGVESPSSHDSMFPPTGSGNGSCLTQSDAAGSSGDARTSTEDAGCAAAVHDGAIGPTQPSAGVPLGMYVKLATGPTSAELRYQKRDATAGPPVQLARPPLATSGGVHISTEGRARFTAAHPVSQPLAAGLPRSTDATTHYTAAAHPVSQPMTAGILPPGMRVTAPALQPLSAQPVGRTLPGSDDLAHRTTRWVAHHASSGPFVNPLFRDAGGPDAEQLAGLLTQPGAPPDQHHQHHSPPHRSQLVIPSRSVIRIPQSVGLRRGMMTGGDLGANLPAQPLLSGPRSHELPPAGRQAGSPPHVGHKPPRVGPHSVSPPHRLGHMPLPAGPHSSQARMPMPRSSLMGLPLTPPGLTSAHQPGGGSAASLHASRQLAATGMHSRQLASGVSGARDIPSQVSSQALSLGSVDDWLPGIPQAIPESSMPRSPPGAVPLGGARRGTAGSTQAPPPPPRHWR